MDLAQPLRNLNLPPDIWLSIILFFIQNFVPENQNCKDLVICLNALKPLLQHRIEEELLEKNSVKWYLAVSLQLPKTLPTGVEDVITAYFSCRNSIEFLAHSIPSHLDEAFDKIKSLLLLRMIAMKNQSKFLKENQKQNWKIKHLYALQIIWGKKSCCIYCYKVISICTNILLPNTILNLK